MNNNFKNNYIKKSLSELENLAQRGTRDDVVTLFKYLKVEQDFFTCKKIDYCLSLINETEGINVIREYLFKGNKIQRNYSALFFKRRNDFIILKKAVQMGCIDEIQAFSR